MFFKNRVFVTIAGVATWAGLGIVGSAYDLMQFWLQPIAIALALLVPFVPVYLWQSRVGMPDVLRTTTSFVGIFFYGGTVIGVALSDISAIRIALWAVLWLGIGATLDILATRAHGQSQPQPA